MADKLKWWLPAVLLLAAFFIWRLTERSNDRSSRPSVRDTAAQVTGSEESGDRPATPTASNHPNAPSAASAPSNWLSEYRCQQPPCAESPFLATSEAEAAWLKRNGFPTQSQRRDAEAMSTLELERRAKAGTLADAALYGERLANEGQSNKAVGVFALAINRGSLYALYSMSDVYAKPGKANPLLSRAYLRAAYLAGDTKATYPLQERFSNFNGPGENVEVDKDAARIHRNLMKYKFVPRPG